MRPEPIPHGRTARRLTWPHLPVAVRAAIESRCGSPVLAAESQDSGYTPGFASVLTCADGSRHFVKAASSKAQRAFAESYRAEARKLAALPRGVPAAHLEWALDGDWMVLCTSYVAGRAPQRPWRAADLDRCLDTLEEVADQLTPVPEGLLLDDLVDDFADWPELWDHVRATRPDLPHLEEAAGLATRAAAVITGDTVVHTDVRDDNILLTEDGVVLCDWNWPARGAAWLDTLFLLLGPRGDGLDAESILATRRLTRDVPPDHVDAVLALLTGYFAKSADDPVPPTSPHLRDHQAWCRDVAWEWLCERRGWPR